MEGDDPSDELVATFAGPAASPLRAVPVDLDELVVIMTDLEGGGEQ